MKNALSAIPSFCNIDDVDEQLHLCTTGAGTALADISYSTQFAHRNNVGIGESGPKPERRLDEPATVKRESIATNESLSIDKANRTSKPLKSDEPPKSFEAEPIITDVAKQLVVSASTINISTDLGRIM